jgi:Cdc6-like AAA superfamily ATPase
MASGVTDPMVVIEFDAKIKEIPYGSNSQFSSNKGCLKGTRMAFLDFIIDWVNDPIPDSERGLVIFGQAGTGKSSIAHEIARQFHETDRLTSSFIFSRSEQSDQKPYHLFTNLAHHLADRYPSFRIALGNIVKDDTALRIDTRHYDVLLESLVLKPLKDLHIVGPILVIIDALDESGDTIGKTGLHKFLAENLKTLPSNFRVVITSRPEPNIVSALANAQSVKTKYMDDTVLAKTHEDILAFFQQRLPSNEFERHLKALAEKAEGSFQWAAVASQLILEPPLRFGCSSERCIKHLLEPSTIHRGQDPLDKIPWDGTSKTKENGISSALSLDN